MGEEVKSELEKRLQAEEAEAAQEKDKEAPEDSPEETVADNGEAAGEQSETDTAAVIAERDGLKDQLLRTRADFDNYRKRMVRQSEQIRRNAAQSLIDDLLPVVDNLERAVEHGKDESGALAEGVRMVLDQLHGVLNKHGVEPIPAEGEPFDPNWHEAVMKVSSEEHGAGTVVTEYQKGYRMGNYVVRPSKVAVSSGSDGGQTGQDSGEDKSTETG